MYELSKGNIDAMSELNNRLVEFIDEASVTPLEAIMVLQILQKSITQAFESRVIEVCSDKEPE